MKTIRKNIFSVSVWPILFGLLIFLTLNRHSKSRVFEYHHEIWADKAGYYVYLPSALIYSNDASKLPQGIDSLTGHGFSIDENKNLIKTKYTYGTALMQAPFFLILKWSRDALGLASSGFEKSFGSAISIAAVFWLCFGLYLMGKTLQQWLSPFQSFISVFLLLTSSGLLYYGISETGMSHVYSFFAFSFLLYQSEKALHSTKLKTMILTGLAIGLIIALRPVNILFIPLPLLFHLLNGKTTFRLLIAGLVHPGVWLTASLIILPQLLYWYQLTGSPFYFSYEGESFDHLSNPALIKFWFAPNNGLFTYHPVWLLMLFMIFTARYISQYPKYFLFSGFVVLSYVFSSWWNWSYGCGFGCRTFTEYSALFYLPLAIALHQSKKKSMLIFTLILLSIWNIKMIYSYDGCWYAADWDWTEYLNLITGPTR